MSSRNYSYLQSPSSGLLCELPPMGADIQQKLPRVGIGKYRRADRSGRTVWAVLGFLILFTILVVMVSKFYLLPGLEAAKHATHTQRRKMAADSLLLLSVMLTILIVGLLLTFRISRFFFPRSGDAPSRTKVVDAWAEAGKRMEESGEEKE